MRHFFSLLFSILVAVAPVFGLYNGNPAAPENVEEGIFLADDVWAGFKLGYQGDFVLDRKLKGRKNVKGRVDDFYALFNQGVLTINAMDLIEVYGSVGAMNASFSHRPHVDNRRRFYQTQEQFAWGAGARAILCTSGNFGLGAEGGYQAGYPRIKYATLDGASQISHAKMCYQEWQIGLGVYYHIEMFTPYLAVDYSVANVTVKRVSPTLLPESSFTMRSRERLGMAIGCTLSSPKIIDLTVEVRLVDEQAIFLAANIKL